ncbi:MAG: hypothetical protein AAFZ15_04735 [Bacteroidota bacterium]
MKEFILILISSFIAMEITSQTIAPPFMQYFPFSTVDRNFYKKNKKSEYAISSFYAAPYVESNSQYRQYLLFLKSTNQDSLLNLAMPNKHIWDELKLTKEEKSYLKENYWVNDFFDDYPVLGLNYSQINRYLYWKTNLLISAYLVFKNKHEKYKLKHGYVDFLKIRKNNPKELFKVINYRELNAGTISKLAVAHEYGFRSIHPNSNEQEPFENWLLTQPEYACIIYKFKTEKEATADIKKKLAKYDIHPVFYSDVKFLYDRSGNILPELLTEVTVESLKHQGSKMVIYDNDEDLSKDDLAFMKEENYLFFKRNNENMLSAKFKIINGQLIKVIKKEVTKNPFFAFRTYMINAYETNTKKAQQN